MEIHICNIDIAQTEQEKILYLFVKPFYYVKDSQNTFRNNVLEFKKHYHRLFSYSYTEKKSKKDIELKYIEKIKEAEPLVLEFIQTLGLNFSDIDFLKSKSVYFKKGKILDPVDFKVFTNQLHILESMKTTLVWTKLYNTFSNFILEIFIKNFLYEKRNIIPYNQDYLDFFKRAIMFFRDSGYIKSIVYLKYSYIGMPIFTHSYSQEYVDKLKNILDIKYFDKS